MPRHLRLTATVILVLFVLSGFSPARSSGGGGGKSRSGSSGSSGGSSSSGGGGCSSKKSSSHSSTSVSGNRGDKDDDENQTGGSDGTGSGSSAADGTRFTVISCASRFSRELSLQGVSQSASDQDYRVTVVLYGKGRTKVDTVTEVIRVPAHDVVTEYVSMDRPSRASKVRRCAITSVVAA